MATQVTAKKKYNQLMIHNNLTQHSARDLQQNDLRDVSIRMTAITWRGDTVSSKTDVIVLIRGQTRSCTNSVLKSNKGRQGFKHICIECNFFNTFEI